MHKGLLIDGQTGLIRIEADQDLEEQTAKLLFHHKDAKTPRCTKGF